VILFVILKYIRSLPNKKILEGLGGRGGRGYGGRGYGRHGRSGYGRRVGRGIAGLGGLGLGYGLGYGLGRNNGGYGGGYDNEFYYDDGGYDYYPSYQQPVYVPEPVYVYEQPLIVNPESSIDLIDSEIYNSM
jgi:hypothetical protein